MKAYAVNNFFKGNYESEMRVNPYNPNVERVYEAIDRIKLENNKAKGNYGVKINVEPKTYQNMLDQANEYMIEALKKNEPFSIPFKITVQIDTSKMPVEILAQIVKTNSRKAQALGKSTNNNSNAVILMYTTRQEYQKKIALKAQSQIDFSKFRCEAKDCGKTNSHRTTLYAVIDKTNKDIKYYGSSCVLKADGNGIIKYLDSALKDVTRLINMIAKVAKKPMDGMNILNILNETLNAYLYKSNSKFYYQKQLQPFITETIQNNVIKIKRIEPFINKNKVLSEFIEFKRQNNANRVEQKLKSIQKEILVKSIMKVLNDLQHDASGFIKYLNRSRAIGTNRSNAKALLKNTQQDNLVRGLTPTKIKNIFYDALTQYVANQSFNDINDNLMQEFFKKQDLWKDDQDVNQIKVYQIKFLEKEKQYLQQCQAKLNIYKEIKDNPSVIFKFLNLDNIYTWDKQPNTLNISFVNGVHPADVYGESINADDINFNVLEQTNWKINDEKDVNIKVENVDMRINSWQKNVDKQTEVINQIKAQSLFEFAEQHDINSEITLDDEPLPTLDTVYPYSGLTVKVSPSDYFKDKLKQQIAKILDNRVSVNNEDFEKFLKQTTKVFLRKTIIQFMEDKVLDFKEESGVSLYGRWYRLDVSYQGTNLGFMFYRSRDELQEYADKVIKSWSNAFVKYYKNEINLEIISKALTDLHGNSEMLLDKGNNQKLILATLKYMPNIIGKVRFRK